MKTLKRLFALIMCLLFLLTPLAVTAEEAPLWGDVDDDGVITTTDARLVLMFSTMKSIPHPIGSEAYEAMKALRDRAHACADVDGDEAITSADARLILQYAVGKIDALPVE